MLESPPREGFLAKSLDETSVLISRVRVHCFTYNPRTPLVLDVGGEGCRQPLEGNHATLVRRPVYLAKSAALSVKAVALRDVVDEKRGRELVR